MYLSEYLVNFSRILLLSQAQIKDCLNLTVRRSDRLVFCFTQQMDEKMQLNLQYIGLPRLIFLFGQRVTRTEFGVLECTATGQISWTRLKGLFIGMHTG